MIETSFDSCCHFDDNLHDVPNNIDEMRKAIDFWRSQFNQPDLGLRHQIQLHGLIGAYSRTVSALDIAEDHSHLAIRLSKTIGDEKLNRCISSPLPARSAIP